MTADYLRPLTGNEPTLLITCFECSADVPNFFDGPVFRHTSLANTLTIDNQRHYKSIRHYIERKNCRKIIVIVNTKCRATNFLINNFHVSGYLGVFASELKQLTKDNHFHLVKEDMRGRFLADMLVFRQCKALMQYDFIREMIAKKSISIHGVIIDGHFGKTLEIVRNEYQYNDSISQN